MNVLFNIQLNNINVQNGRLHNVDPYHNHDFQLPNYIKCRPKSHNDEPIICNDLQLLVTLIFLL